MATLLLAVLSAVNLRVSDAIIRELYTTNAVCKQQYCVNPVFPALQDLPKLEKSSWQKRSLGNVSQWIGFCSSFVDYDVALPGKVVQLDGKSSALTTAAVSDENASSLLSIGAETSLKEIVASQDQQAAKMYFFHLSGMGIEPWDHRSPDEDSSHPLRSCARSVARMACYTYFPAALQILKDGTEVRYKRPCSSSCQSYIEACGVECCDESAACVWSAPHSEDVDQETEGSDTPRRTQDRTGAEIMLYTGYSEDTRHCTGAP